VAFVLPGSDKAKIFIIAKSFSFRSLAFFTEVSAARFGTLQCIETHQLGKLKEIRNPSGLLQRLIQFLVSTKDVHVPPVLFFKRRNHFQCLLEPFFSSGHPAIIPKNLSEFAVK